MPPVVHRYDLPERFVAGTVGPPGQRTFFLQARAGVRVTSVALEKQQVLVLAERIDEMLDEVMRTPSIEATIPAVAPLDLEDSLPLEQPIVEEFRAGTMKLAWDNDEHCVVVEVFPYVDTPVELELDPDSDPSEMGGEPDALALEVEPEPEEVLLVRLAPGPARAFCKRAQAVVAAGRPPCPFCGGPVEPSGHLCPRSNGFRRVATAEP